MADNLQYKFLDEVALKIYVTNPRCQKLILRDWVVPQEIPSIEKTRLLNALSAVFDNKDYLDASSNEATRTSILFQMIKDENWLPIELQECVKTYMKTATRFSNKLIFSEFLECCQPVTLYAPTYLGTLADKDYDAYRKNNIRYMICDKIFYSSAIKGLEQYKYIEPPLLPAKSFSEMNEQELNWWIGNSYRANLTEEQKQELRKCWCKLQDINLEKAANYWRKKRQEEAKEKQRQKTEWEKKKAEALKFIEQNYGDENENKRT